MPQIKDKFLQTVKHFKTDMKLYSKLPHFLKHFPRQHMYLVAMHFHYCDTVPLVTLRIFICYVCSSNADELAEGSQELGIRYFKTKFNIWIYIQVYIHTRYTLTIFSF
jgi:hypothetical protein